MPSGNVVMKVVILAGGLGTRISEETHSRPKPMVEVGDRPLIWHIMKTFSHYGHLEFIICCGYLGYVIKEYFSNYTLHMSDVTVDMERDSVLVHRRNAEPWKVTLVDTGADTLTGGRLKRVESFLDDDPFFFTYGDGLSDVDLNRLMAFHISHGRKASVTAVKPPGRFGVFELDGNRVSDFAEKPVESVGRINGGYFVLNKSCLEYIDGDLIPWEGEPLRNLVMDDELRAYKHDGFWQPMDTLRDKRLLEQLWATGSAPWKVW